MRVRERDRGRGESVCGWGGGGIGLSVREHFIFFLLHACAAYVERVGRST